MQSWKCSSECLPSLREVQGHPSLHREFETSQGCKGRCLENYETGWRLFSPCCSEHWSGFREKCGILALQPLWSEGADPQVVPARVELGEAPRARTGWGLLLWLWPREPLPNHSDFNSNPNNCLPTKASARERGGARASDIARSGRPSAWEAPVRCCSGPAAEEELEPGPRLDLARFNRVTSSLSCQPPEVRAVEPPSLSLCASPASLGLRSCRWLRGSRVRSSPPRRKGWGTPRKQESRLRLPGLLPEEGSASSPRRSPRNLLHRWVFGGARSVRTRRAWKGNRGASGAFFHGSLTPLVRKESEGVPAVGRAGVCLQGIQCRTHLLPHSGQWWPGLVPSEWGGRGIAPGRASPKS